MNPQYRSLRANLFFLLLAAFPASLQARDKTLAPSGQLNELHAAVAEIRKERAATGDLSPVRVEISGGTYRFDAPLVLEPGDSDISFEAKTGSHPVFDGGQAITGWKADSQGHWTTQVDPQWRFEALWVNGKRAIRARTPNKGFFQATEQPGSPVENVPLAGDTAKTVIGISPDNAALLGALSPEEQRGAQVLVYHSWDVSRLHLAGLKASEGKLQFTGPSREFFASHSAPRLRFENYLGAMDEPGEWFLEQNGTLHYIPLPGETPQNAVVTAPVASQWIVFKGAPEKGTFCDNIHFKSLKFQHQQWLTPQKGIHAGQAEANLPFPAVEITGGRNIVFENCEFLHTMTHAAWLRAGCSASRFTHCLFADLGAGGVYVGESGAKQDGPKHTHHIEVENCIFRTGGRHFPAGIGVTLFHASDCAIRHCDIGDFYYDAISIGWTWGYAPTVAGRNLVEFCHLHHLGWGELSDLGAVYTLGQQLGTVIRNNRIHSVSCDSYGGWGMYNDEGSTGVLWENNLVYDTQTAGYHQHYGRGNLVRNNILAWGKEEHLRRSKAEDRLAFGFERNIVLMGEGKLFTRFDQNWHDGRVFLADNVYWHPKGVPTDFAGKTWAQWQADGNDVRSVLADPLFKDPEHGDWSLAADSPALKLGFQPFDWKAAGVYGEQSWKDIAAAPLPAFVFGEKKKPTPLRVTESFDRFETGKRLNLGRTNPNQPALFAVEGIPSNSGKCLELRDGPDQTAAYEPHFAFDPSHTEGTTRVAFDLRMEPQYRFLHEWRDDSSPYKTSVYLSVENGAIKAGGKKLADFPPLTWVHFEIVAAVGAQADGAWDLCVTPEGGQTQVFQKLPSQKGGGIELRWLGFISPGTENAKAWLDNLSVENR